jgi:hypothetical protein
VVKKCGGIIVCAHLRRAAVLKSQRQLPQGGRDTTLTLAVVSNAQNVGSVTLTRYDFLFPHTHLVVDQTVLLHVVAVLDQLCAHFL